VVATDFSDSAAAALEWAVDLANAHEAKIVLAHAIETELPALAESAGRINTFVREKLEAAGKRLTDAHVLAQTEYDQGRPWRVIADIASKAHADLIVVGTHTKSKFRMLGRVVDRLIRTTSIPVLVHRAGADDARKDASERARETTLGIRTVVAATDFSDEATLALKTAMGLLSVSIESAQPPIRLVLFHAVPAKNIYDFHTPAYYPAYWGDMERVANAELKTLADKWRSDQLQVETKLLRGNASEAILDEAHAIQADLIAIGTVGRSGLSRFLMGSVAQRVLHHANCPVLVVRKPESAGEQHDHSSQDES